MSQNAEFFLVALPGLEDLVQAEAQEWFPNLEFKSQHGGVTVMAPVAEGLSMNLALKTPTRVLIRVDSLRARDFPKMFNQIRSIDWQQWIDPTSEIEVQASTRLSRLKIKSRIEETCQDALMDYRKKIGVTIDRDKKLTLLIRFVEDQYSLSLDTSGERLHKRGIRQHIGEAPLRETIAAALIQLVGRKYPADDRPVEIIDPMMGSGVFLLEAEFRDQLVETRDFAFEVFNDPKVKKPVLPTPRPKIESLVGFEHDPKTLKAAQKNLKSLPGNYAVNLKGENFFKAEPMPPTSTHQRWLFCNPPYNERLKIKEPLNDFYGKLFEASDRVAKPDRACFILPSKAVKGKFILPLGWKVLEKRPFVNGGIPVVAFIFGRNVKSTLAK